jgi:hypothetical protein
MAQTSPERRLSDRIPSIFGIQVYAYGMLIANGQTVDISDRGILMRIEQDYSDDELHPGKHLDIMFTSPPERWLPIKVVRKCERGIAALFIGVDASEYCIQ